MIKHRIEAVKYINDHKIDIFKRDIYEFGVYTASSMILIEEQLLNYKLKPNCIYGFDSFIGLPEEEKNINCRSEWYKGQFDSRDFYKDNDIDSIIQRIKDALMFETILIPGFFDEVLNEELVKKYNMQSACLIDIDVDLYISTKQIFEFMYKFKLIQKDTIIIYDDWGGVKEYTGGESLAHKEFIEKYNIKVKEIFSIRTSKNHAQKVFIIEEIKY